MKFIDTNILLRYLLGEDSIKTSACGKLLKKAAHHTEVFWTTDLVIAEIIWVLESFYKFPKQKIAEAILTILNTSAITMDRKDLIMSAVGLYELKNIDFVDAYNAIMMREKGIKEIYSYDKDFNRIPFVQRLEP